MTLVNVVPGRIRVRANALRDPEVAQRVEAEVAGTPGVDDARVNRGAASLVVLYDPERVDVDALERRIEVLCRNPRRKPTPRRSQLGRTLNLANKAAMTTTLAGSVAYAVIGKKKPHARLGAAFVALVGLHLLRNRTTLMR